MTIVQNIIVASAVTILLASGAEAQTSSRTFHLTTLTSPVAVRGIGTIVRVFAAKQTSVNEASQTISVSGSSSDLALAAWLVEQFDSTRAKPAILQYTVQGSPQSAVRIFYLSNIPRQTVLNEFASILRTVGDIQNIFAVTPEHAVGIRTTEAQAQLAEWLVQQLDVTHADRRETICFRGSGRSSRNRGSGFPGASGNRKRPESGGSKFTPRSRYPLYFYP